MYCNNTKSPSFRLLINDVVPLYCVYQTMNYDIYVFDLDGTLLNTLDDLAASVNHALALHGMPRHSTDEIRRFVGNGVRNLVIRATPGGSDNPRFESVLATFKTHYSTHNLDRTKPYDGIMQMLHTLKGNGKLTAVVSNKYDAATKHLCRHFFGNLIDVAIGEHEGIRRKPASDTVNEALKLLGGVRQRAVYIGDSDVDIVTARNAGLPCISVSWGFRDKDFLLKHGATTIVTRTEEIISHCNEPGG